MPAKERKSCIPMSTFKKRKRKIEHNNNVVSKHL